MTRAMKSYAMIFFAIIGMANSAFVGSDKMAVRRSLPWTVSTRTSPTIAKQRYLPHVDRSMARGMMLESVSEAASSAFVSSSNAFLLATIDSDIANIPENEFAPIFIGGLSVMAGGIVSAVIVGFILDRQDNYASVVADSYAQGGEDEEFWNSLSEEETTKMKALLEKVRDSKKGGDAEAEKSLRALEAAQVKKVQVVPKAGDLDMFSDYSEE